MDIKLAISILALIVPIMMFGLASTWGVVGWLVKSLKQVLTQKLDAMTASLADESRKIAHVEKSLLELKADLPREYVRREDHIRYSAVIEAKIDAQASAIQSLSLNVQRALDHPHRRKEKDE